MAVRERLWSSSRRLHGICFAATPVKLVERTICERFTDEPSDVALVKGENVSQGSILWDISKRWPASDWETLKKFQLAPDDVVVLVGRERERITREPGREST